MASKTATTTATTSAASKPTTGSAGSWVTLNVSGTLFRTTRATLTADPTSMLAAWMKDDAGWAVDGPAVDETGAFLIDRDPVYFRPVLNFLRTRKVVIDPGVAPEGVLEEARFFQVAELEAALSAPDEEVVTDLTRADIVKIIATSTHRSFRGLNLTGIVLDALDLRGCDFDYCNLSDASFQGADLSRSTFRSAECTGAKFDAAIISFCSFYAADCSRATFRFADGDGSLDEYTGFIEAELTEADFSDSNLKCARFNMASLIDCRFLRASLHVAGFEKSNLLRTNFSGAHVYRARFYEADNMDSCVEPPWLAHLRVRGSVGEDGAPPPGGIGSPPGSGPGSPTSTTSGALPVDGGGRERGGDGARGREEGSGQDGASDEKVPLPVGPSGMLPSVLRRAQESPAAAQDEDRPPAAVEDN